MESWEETSFTLKVEGHVIFVEGSLTIAQWQKVFSFASLILEGIPGVIMCTAEKDGQMMIWVDG